MQVVSNAGVGESHLANLLQIIKSSERIVICSGWMKMGGLRLIFPESKQLLPATLP